MSKRSPALPASPDRAGATAPRRATDVAVAAVSLALAVWVTGGLWRDPNGRAIEVNSGDQALFEWLLAFGARWSPDGHGPLFTHLLNVPDGVNLAVNTSITAYALAFAPLTWLAGPPVAFLVILTLNLAATGFAWYLLLSRTLGASRLAAAVGGLFCGFAPGLVSHANAHLNWTAQWLSVLIVWRVLALRQPSRSMRNGVILGLLITACFSVAAEALFFTALACAVFVSVWALDRRAEARAAARPFLRGLAVAAGVAFALLAYPLWMHFFGPQRYGGIGFDQRIHSEDLAAYGAYPDRSLAGLIGLNGRLAPNPTEETTFFGPPLLLLAVACFVLLWRGAARDAARRAVLRAVGVTALVFAVLSLGPRLKVFGDITAIRLPYVLVARLPMFNAALPARFALVVAPIVGMLLAWTIDLASESVKRAERASDAAGSVASESVKRAELANDATGMKARSWSLRWRRGLAVALAVALLPLVPVPLLTVERAPVPRFITTGAWREELAPGRTLVPVPLPSDLTPDGQRWQAAALAARGDVFPVPAGFFLGPGGPDGRGRIGPVPRPTAELLERVAKTGAMPAVTDSDRTAAREDLAFWRAGAVVLADDVHGAKWPTHPDALLRVLTDLLGPPRRVSDVWLWHVP